MARFNIPGEALSLSPPIQWESPVSMPIAPSSLIPPFTYVRNPLDNNIVLTFMLHISDRNAGVYSRPRISELATRYSPAMTVDYQNLTNPHLPSSPPIAHNSRASHWSSKPTDPPAPTP
ncbi:hypothetical protein N7532_002681 [Penicillium argentinense]|uniref:Uncharacterized protein n=1 Tax=Penicillium argentinense TaxID=1131581 RepID=A0A9W9G0S6_9EURO|nr:uncharacterized protein N7532_002681 [Penicillium argentinense]KAJ5110036.1 hypothetical protein N7532_002681 [Penicillium argentinense]